MDLLKQIDALQKEIDSLRPLKKAELEQLRDYFKIGLTYSSNAIEGNTLTESETKVVIEDGLTVHGKPLKDHYEAIGHAKAFDYLFELVKKEEIGEGDIKQLHYLLYQKIDDQQAGKYRKQRVFLSGSRYPLPDPKKVPGLMNEMCSNFSKWKKSNHPVAYAAVIHKELEFIHPFVDGNGRVGRLIMNLALLQAGYVVTIIPPVRRPDYISLLEKAHTDDKPFIEFIAECVLETQKDYLRLLNG